jgi:hypothetical protein
VAVDWATWPDCLDAWGADLPVLAAEWRQEYAAHVHPLPAATDPFGGLPLIEPHAAARWWESWPEELADARYELVEDPKDHEPATPEPVS